jgi:hypothetical protein
MYVGRHVIDLLGDMRTTRATERNPEWFRVVPYWFHGHFGIAEAYQTKKVSR